MSKKKIDLCGRISQRDYNTIANYIAIEADVPIDIINKEHVFNFIVTNMVTTCEQRTEKYRVKK